MHRTVSDNLYEYMYLIHVPLHLNNNTQKQHSILHFNKQIITKYVFFTEDICLFL